MIKKIFIFAAAALVLTACAQKRFDSVESTLVSRYDIVYDGDRCGRSDQVPSLWCAEIYH